MLGREAPSVHRLGLDTVPVVSALNGKTVSEYLGQDCESRTERLLEITHSYRSYFWQRRIRSVVDRLIGNALSAWQAYGGWSVQKQDNGVSKNVLYQSNG